MAGYLKEIQKERVYFKHVLSVIKSEVIRLKDILSRKKQGLIASRKDMWENTAHFSSDFAKLTEMNQYLLEVSSQAADYAAVRKQVEEYKGVVQSPYFGRFDFKEDGSGCSEKIYIGRQSVMEAEGGGILVYDWRAPVSGMYYRYEPGKASYSAPLGRISGDILLKRQYRIKDSRLIYFFDCSVVITDEILHEVLSRSSSPRMRDIVETIQREQDSIIRDTEAGLLVVQGVAGSGKTSIALHRIAFLLYRGMGSGIQPADFLIISPSNVFSSYISWVLPGLGEENVARVTFDDILSGFFEGRFPLQGRNDYLESVACSPDGTAAALSRNSAGFKGSREFVAVLDRLVDYYLRHRVPFEDVYYDGRTIESKQRLKNMILHRDRDEPAAARLKRMEGIILDRVHPLQRKRVEKIGGIVALSEGHQLEVKSFSRLLSMKQSRVFMDRIRRWTRVDFFEVYKTLFMEPGLLSKLAGQLELPGEIGEIVSATRQSLEKSLIRHEDSAPLLYLKLKLEGSGLYGGIRHVVIDEAQDYTPLHYEIFKILFRHASYTVLGDIRQAVTAKADHQLYDVIAKILDKHPARKIDLKKSYRSSFEISDFSRTLLGEGGDLIPFERHGDPPRVVEKDNRDLLDRAMARDIEEYMKQGYSTIAVICKSRWEAGSVYDRLKGQVSLQLVSGSVQPKTGGVLAIPFYLARGLEFDVVLVPGVSRENYASELDRRILYISCTRALHRLALYYAGEISPLLVEQKK